MRSLPKAMGVGRSLAILFGGVAGLAPAPANAQDAAPTEAARTVEINEYFVEGNHVLSDPEIERAVYPFLGPQKTLGDVELARAALQSAYEAKGLKTVFVEIPQQNVQGGRVVLSVVETRVGTVTVAGVGKGAGERVTAALRSIRPGAVPDLNQFSEQLATLNSRTTDRQITPELKAGAMPGTVDVALSVDDKLPLHGSVELSNRYSRDTTRTRAQASLRYDNLWGIGHSISAFYAVAPERRSDSEVYVLGYGAPLSNSMRIDVTGLISNSDVATVGSTSVLGNGQSLSAVLTKTLGGSDGLYHRITASLAYKDFDEEVRFGTLTDTAPITYFPIALGYGGSLAGQGYELGFNTDLTFAFRGLGSNSYDFEYKRYRATGGFAYLRANGNIRRDMIAGTDLYVSVNGQIASEPLVSNEQFAAGGAGSVRGYLQSEAIGDDGLGATIEFRSPSFGSLFGFDDFRVIAFADGAQVWVKDVLAQQQSSQGLIGVGGGIRFRLFGHLGGDLDLAVPLRSAGSSDAGDPRVHFRVSADF